MSISHATWPRASQSNNQPHSSQKNYAPEYSLTYPTYLLDVGIMSVDILR